VGTFGFERLIEAYPADLPGRVVGDEGYSHDRIHRCLRERGVGAVIPLWDDQTASEGFDETVYRRRNRGERLVNQLKQFRRIATRYEKRTSCYLAMLTIAAVVLWL
jgi:transposase